MNQSNKKNLEFIKNSGINYFLQDSPRNWFENTNKVEKQLKAHNERFNKTIEIDSMYNRLVMFDASQWHMANSFLDDNLEEERFIMVTFFNRMECNSKILPNQMIRFPLPEMRRT